MQRNTLAALHVVLFNAGLFTLPVQAQDIPLLDEILVTATRIPTSDILATYASEVHSRKAIEQSGSATLYDYLAHHTSVNMQPGYGNRDSPLIDIRGYGISDGYQNVVVTLDGRRLNNIDGAPQLLGAIPLRDIDRIEITKGSGSVLFGDGATAGSIQIYTRPHKGASIDGSLGSFGQRNLTATSGVSSERISLSASANYSGKGGYSEQDPTGNKDASSNRTWRGSLALRPNSRVNLSLDGSSNIIDARFPSPLSQDMFNANPRQLGANLYTTPVDAYSHQYMKSDLWRLGGSVNLTQDWSISAHHSREDKFSDFITSGYAYRYDNIGDEVAAQFRGGSLDFTIGMQTFDGTRMDRNGWSDNDTRKLNTGWFMQAQVRQGETTYSVGVRTEKVDYRFSPLAGSALESSNQLNAWDIGVNHRLDLRTSLFANYNRGFQAPDIDRFFNLFSGSFNGFIAPAVSHTLNLGFNHVTKANRLKATLFRVDLDNEIYYFDTGNTYTSYNTNLDKTHKYGFEIRDDWRATENLTASGNYAYTRAIIDHENDGAGSFNGKDLPGVPRHTASLSLEWQATAAAQVHLTHAWRGGSIATGDFANALSQRQRVYQSTDVALRYRSGRFEWFGGVDNMFEHKNGLWVKSVNYPGTAEIYPVNFTRVWRLGLKAEF
jgi:iron complex outermembrane receptor protein